MDDTTRAAQIILGVLLDVTGREPKPVVDAIDNALGCAVLARRIAEALYPPESD